MTAREYQDQLLIDKGFDDGFDEGKFSIALRIKAKFGIDEAVELGGFSREELENEELSK